MPKGAAAAAGRAPKVAKVTPEGEPRCDRLLQVVYENQCSELVNGRSRHWDCWPAYVKLNHEWWAAWEAIRADYVRNKGTTYYKEALAEFSEKLHWLIDKDSVLKAVNGISKGMRDELLRTSGMGLQTNIAMVLAGKERTTASSAP